MPALEAFDGKLAENIVHFVRALRRAGVRVGTAQLHSALEAVNAAGFTRREDFYITLRATLVSRPEQFETFHQVFRLFWRTPDFIERMMEMMLPVLQTVMPEKGPPEAAQRRSEEAMSEGGGSGQAAAPEVSLDVDARMSWSAAEVFKAKDFDQMSAAELSEAEAAMRRMRLPVPPLKTRRAVTSKHGSQPDLRATLRRALRRGGELDRVVMQRRGARAPNLVVLCDVSGSMASYARMMMHFLHALTWAPERSWAHVHAFTFGTRLTNITPALAKRDVDAALKALSTEVADWDGGTRIGEALTRFNKDWSRRVLGQGAVVLLITDGLERGDLTELRQEAERLSLSCRRLIWLNPLLRWEAFEPKAGGIRTLLPFADSFHACHSLNAMSDLAEALNPSFFSP